jgi:hypothetical protein
LSSCRSVFTTEYWKIVFFISVQLRGIYRFLWKIALLTILVIFEYTILHCRALCTCTWCNQMHVSFFSGSFLTVIESILGKIQIITPNQRMFLFIFKKSILTHMLKIRTYKWWSKYCKWLTTIVCIHFCKNYLT